MNLRKRECLLQNIKNVMRQKESGQIGLSVGTFMILFVMVFLCAALQLERYRVAAGYMEDALAASALASAVIDVEEYGITNNIIIEDYEEAYARFARAVKGNLNLDDSGEGKTGGVVNGKVSIVKYIIYNVSGQTVRVECRDENGAISVQMGNLGELTAPNGVRIESTSVYGEVAFFVESFPGMNMEARQGKLVDIVRCVVN